MNSEQCENFRPAFFSIYLIIVLKITENVLLQLNQREKSFCLSSYKKVVQKNCKTKLKITYISINVKINEDIMNVSYTN